MRPSRSRPTAERVAAHGLGHRGETLAALLLRLKLYRIVARRFKTPVGEIDIVARRGDTTVFIEVKTRRGADTEATALAAVDTRRIGRAAQFYLARHPHLAVTPLRFDVIFVARRAWPRHLTNAFMLQDPRP